MRGDRDSNQSQRTRGRRQSTARQPTPPLQQSDRELASRLEAGASGASTPLTNDQVERVLGRAAEIDSGLEDDLAIDAAALIKAAREVGLSESSVRRALAEERSVEKEPDGFFARLLVGDEVVESDLVELDLPGASSILDGWMRTSEGLRPARVANNAARWEPDRAWATRVRLSLNRETSGLRLDGALPVSHALTEVSPSETLVAMKADTELLRRGATGGVIATGVVGTAVAAPLLAMSDGVGETVAILTSTGLGVGGIGSAIVFATRWHVAQLRAALRRPIDAVSRAEKVKEPPKLVDTVLDVADKLRRRRRKT